MIRRRHDPFHHVKDKRQLRIEIVEQFEKKLISYKLALALLLDAGMETSHAALYLKKDHVDD